MTPPKFIPVGDRVLVEPLEDTQPPGQMIVIPDQAKDTPTTGIVRALGAGKRDRDGNRLPYEFKCGDRVIYSKYGGTVVKANGIDYKLLSSDEIIAVIEAMEEPLTVLANPNAQLTPDPTPTEQAS